MNIQLVLPTLPESAGVYIMKNAAQEIIYIGKAVNIRRRVRSHFWRPDSSPKQRVLISHISAVEAVPTPTPEEALILEAALIKEYRPKYNSAIKDDKAYPLLRLSVQERYPRLSVVRRERDDGARYYGPYTSGLLLRKAVSWLRRAFPLRMCNGARPGLCFYAHLNQCPGPHDGVVDEAAYQRTVTALSLFLEGKKTTVLAALKQEMAAAAAALDFERALTLRAQLESLHRVPLPQAGGSAAAQLEELRLVLGLATLPRCIEGYDISTLAGTLSVGVMVCFEDGRAVKSRYRRFRIRTVPHCDDFAMMREIIQRRFRGSLAAEYSWPDLLLIDGGRGHVQAVLDVLRQLSITLPVIGIAKRYEYIYRADQPKPLALPRRSPALRLLQRIRDEAHRFVITYYRRTHRRTLLLSRLEEIPGIGKKRRALLLTALSARPADQELSPEFLQTLPGIDRRTARLVFDYWQQLGRSDFGKDYSRRHG